MEVGTYLKEMDIDQEIMERVEKHRKDMEMYRIEMEKVLLYNEICNRIVIDNIEEFDKEELMEWKDNLACLPLSYGRFVARLKKENKQVPETRLFLI